MSRIRWVFLFASVFAVLTVSNTARAQDASIRTYSPCRDAWVTSAFKEVSGWVANEPTSRKPFGFGDTEECNPRLYGGGSWSSYADLVNKVRANINGRMSGVCRDSYVTQAVTAVKTQLGIRNSSNFAPQGYGEVGECNMYLYGNGSWSSYDDLKNKVLATFTGFRNNGVGFDYNGNFVKGGSTFIPKNRIVIVAPGQLSAAISAGIVAGGAGNIIAAGAGNIIAAGAGNVTAGSATIIAGGAGN